jgi:hypothetical protein
MHAETLRDAVEKKLPFAGYSVGASSREASAERHEFFEIVWDDFHLRAFALRWTSRIGVCLRDNRPHRPVLRSSRSERRRKTPGSKFAGGHRSRVTPVPIPNTEVKPTTADGTAWETVWESRSLPALFLRRPDRESDGPFCLYTPHRCLTVSPTSNAARSS